MQVSDLHYVETCLFDHFSSNIKFSWVLFASSDDDLQQQKKSAISIEEVDEQLPLFIIKKARVTNINDRMQHQCDARRRMGKLNKLRLVKASQKKSNTSVASTRSSSFMSLCYGNMLLSLQVVLLAR
jgi:hypothetical protein